MPSSCAKARIRRVFRQKGVPVMMGKSQGKSRRQSTNSRSGTANGKRSWNILSSRSLFESSISTELSLTRTCMAN